MRKLQVGDTVTFNDAAWAEAHGDSRSEFSGRSGVLQESSYYGNGWRGHGNTWSVYFADEDYSFGIHETWLLPMFVIEESP